MALTEEKIELLKIDFESGELPVTEIARKHAVGRSTVIRMAEKGEWSREDRPRLRPPKKKETPKRGRPTKYNPDCVKQVTALCMLGYTNEQLAEFLNIHESRFYEWKKRHPEFQEALLSGREKAGARMAVSLFQRGTGYSHKDEKIFQYEGEIIRAATVKHYPPETRAAELWLKAKYPELWNTAQKIDVSDRTLRTTIPGQEPIEDEKDFADFVANELSK